MRQQRQTLSPDVEAHDNILSHEYWRSHGSDNSKEIRRMIKFLVNAMDKVLTPSQNTCITMVFFDGKKQKEVAEILGLSRSTVSRHIKAGLQKLKDASELYIPYEEDDSENEIEEMLRNI